MKKNIIIPSIFLTVLASCNAGVSNNPANSLNTLNKSKINPTITPPPGWKSLGPQLLINKVPTQINDVVSITDPDITNTNIVFAATADGLYMWATDGSYGSQFNLIQGDQSDLRNKIIVVPPKTLNGSPKEVLGYVLGDVGGGNHSWPTLKPIVYRNGNNISVTQHNMDRGAYTGNGDWGAWGPDFYYNSVTNKYLFTCGFASSQCNIGSYGPYSPNNGVVSVNGVEDTDQNGSSNPWDFSYQMMIGYNGWQNPAGLPGSTSVAQSNLQSLAIDQTTGDFYTFNAQQIYYAEIGSNTARNNPYMNYQLVWDYSTNDTKYANRPGNILFSAYAPYDNSGDGIIWVVKEDQAESKYILDYFISSKNQKTSGLWLPSAITANNNIPGGNSNMQSNLGNITVDHSLVGIDLPDTSLPTAMIADKYGRIWMSFSDGNVYTLTGDGWSTPVSFGTAAGSITSLHYDTNSNYIYLGTANGYIYEHAISKINILSGCFLPSNTTKKAVCDTGNTYPIDYETIVYNYPIYSYKAY